MPTVEDVAALVVAHSWIPLLALIVFAVVRLLKSDTKIPINIPPRFRPVLAVVLGSIGGVLDHVASGTPWKQAMINGATGGVLAILANVFGIDVLRGGRDVPMPKALSSRPPPPDGPSSIYRGPSPPAVPVIPDADDSTPTKPARRIDPRTLYGAAYARALILFAPFVVAAMFGAVACAAASGAGAQDPARETARGAILTVAEAVRVADGVCADLALARKDAELARRCARAYDIARPGLLAAERGVDAWDTAERGQIVCSLDDAAKALTDIEDAIATAGGKPPPVAADAHKLAALLGGCHVGG
ncbi:MAG: hypothetical protein JWM74_1801 [Myxococcaceae bacterium]|nr:hypothetical protein [Myxococcaceae bacterium]